MIAHPPSQSLFLTVPAALLAAVLSAMPAQVVEAKDYNVRVKHTEAATKRLRELGFPAPSPIVTNYKWPLFKGVYKPFDHQRYMAEFMTLHRRCFNLSEMGSGKTNAALYAADYLISSGKIRKTVILSPLSTLSRVWQQGIFELLMHRTCVIVHGTREKRLAALALDVDFYIINHDGITIPPIMKELCRREDIDLIIVDEGSKFRNSQTDKWKALKLVCNKPVERRLWWLTGTPAPHGPDDVWAQCKLVCPDRVSPYMGAWRRDTMMELAPHIWKPRVDGFKKAWEAMQPAVRFTKEECLDLPPCTTIDIECELSAEQRKLIKEMAKAGSAEISGGVKVTAANAADKLNKLRQILLGSVKVGDDYLSVDASPRLAAAREVIEMATTKTILIVPFKGALRQLEAELSKTYTVGVVNGDVPVKKRDEIFRAFSYEAHPQVLLCHPTVMSHGLTLTSANVMGFYGPLFSNDEYRQVVERINRPGQKEKMTIARIGGHKIEWTIYASLDTYELGQTSILALYNAFLETAGKL